MIPALPSNATSDAHRIGILPRAPRCGQAFLHPRTARRGFETGFHRQHRDRAALPRARSTGAAGSPDAAIPWCGATCSRPPACCSRGWPTGASSKPGATGCGNASASRRPRSPPPGSWRSSSTACGAMEPTLSGHQRKWQLRSNNPPEFRESGTDVPVGTAASERSTEALRCFIEASACSTLIRQRPPTPSCRGPSPYRGENSEPDRRIKGELDIQPRVREQPQPDTCIRAISSNIESR